MTSQTIPVALPVRRLIARVALAWFALALAVCSARFGRCAEDQTSPAAGDSNAPIRFDNVEEDIPVAPRNNPGDAATPAPRLREGTMLNDVVGRFKVSGDQASFIANETGHAFGGLQNLNLARVMNIIRDDPEAEWSVSGLVTEYRGLNYLLISKAIRKAGGDKRNKRPSLSQSDEVSKGQGARVVNRPAK